jgi:hypothetical protein
MAEYDNVPDKKKLNCTNKEFVIDVGRQTM